MSNKKNILVTGANGQLGMELRMLEKKYPQHQFFFMGKNDLSVTDENAVADYFFKQSFDFCINCAAYTAVDAAETQADDAFQLNAVAPGILAAICKKYDTAFIQLSTDYVFDGNATVPYKETDATNPVNVYGSSKLAGELQTLEMNASAIIIRTSWVYSSFGKNFVKTMLRLMKEKENLSVVNDQYGSPTYAADLADTILTITLNKNLQPGIYHYCNRGNISWYDFAMEIKRLTNSPCNVNSIVTTDYPTAAKRPQSSVLDTGKIKAAFGISIPDWQESLEKCLKLIG